MTPKQNPQNQDFINTIHAVLDAYDTISLSLFQSQSMTLSEKNDATPVTLADKKAEETARHIISTHHPSHAIWGEEMKWGKNQKSPLPNTSEEQFLWILDPIDGTRSFATGNPLFGCMIALVSNQSHPISAVSMPALKERWMALSPQYSVRITPSQSYTLSSSSCSSIKHARLAATSHVLFNQKEWKLFQNVSQNVALTRFGGDCYNYLSLAAGWLDIVIEADMAVHDYIPLIPILTASGAVISDWNGNPLNHNPLSLKPAKNSKQQILATANPSLHTQVLNILNTPYST
jgi:histidinol phosphatase-like enzyme (inositol monophosphatase family)